MIILLTSCFRKKYTDSNSLLQNDQSVLIKCNPLNAQVKKIVHILSSLSLSLITSQWVTRK